MQDDLGYSLKLSTLRPSEKKTHRYVCFDSIYYLEKQSIVNLCRLLCRSNVPFSLRKPSNRRVLSKFPPTLLLPWRIYKLFEKFLSPEHKSISVISLPIKAHIVVKTWPSGYKYFDYKNNFVTVDAPLNATILPFAEHTAMLSRIGECGLGPKVSNVDTNSRIYTESMLSGVELIDPAADSNSVMASVRTFIQQMWTCGGRRRINVAKYKSDLIEYNYRSLGLLDPSGCFGVSTSIQRFIERQDTCFKLIGEDYLELVLTHGDFRERNFLMDGTKVKAFDWSTLSWRSKLFDLYSLFFSAIVRNAGCEKYKRYEILDSNVRILRRFDFNIVQSEEYSVGEKDIDLYFSVFTLEFILLRIQHFLLPDRERQGGSCKRIRRLESYIDEFVNYKEYVSFRSEPEQAGVRR